MRRFIDHIVTYIPFQIPSSESFDSAATVPLGLDTALVGLYGNHFGAGVTPPWTKSAGGHEPKKPIVVIGGSSSVGSYGKRGRTRLFDCILTVLQPSNLLVCQDFIRSSLQPLRTMKTLSGTTAQPTFLIGTFPANN
jgi:hypothetical protein